MIQTSYVPLEHPFQIIEYKGVLGIQIGTLIVTVDKSEETEKGYAIETGRRRVRHLCAPELNLEYWYTFLRLYNVRQLSHIFFVQ